MACFCDEVVLRDGLEVPERGRQRGSTMLVGVQEKNGCLGRHSGLL